MPEAQVLGLFINCKVGPEKGFLLDSNVSQRNVLSYQTLYPRDAVDIQILKWILGCDTFLLTRELAS
jgi:hypothetical protein